MSTLTRRDRVAMGADQGGALYYGGNRRWPEPAFGVFEKFGTLHPGPFTPPVRPPSDKFGHQIKGFTVSDIDGTPKLYSGYGHAVLNKAPIYIWPLSLDGVWDATPAHTMQTFGMRNYRHAEGKLWCFGDQGPADFSTGNPGGTWFDGRCRPATSAGGFVHAHALARHDGYTWMCGQQTTFGNSGGVWRGAHPTGEDGEFLLGHSLGLVLYTPTEVFSYQGKLWMQPNRTGYGGLPPYEDGRLCYWDEAAYKFLPTDLRLDPVSNPSVPWKTVMLKPGSSGLQAFNGTSFTTVYDNGAVDLCVTSDDTVWVLDVRDRAFWSSTDLVTWTKRAQIPKDIDTTWSFTVYEDCIYIGDEHDQIWRARVMA